MGSMPSQVFEVLHRAFVVLRLFPRVEGAQVAALAGDWILLARIEPVLARSQFSDHGHSPVGLPRQLQGRLAGDLDPWCPVDSNLHIPHGKKYKAWIVFGLIVGIVAKLLMPGRDPGGVIVTILLGIAGALVGGFLGRIIGLYREGDPVGFIYRGCLFLKTQ